MLHKKRWIIYLVLSTLFITTLAIAKEGCFTYSGSTLNCFNLKEKAALEECMTYQKCNFKETFFPGKNCNKPAIFPQCKEIYCQSTCKYQPAGTCSGGAVPAGQEQQWCSSGCCQFSSQGATSCNYKTSRWLCGIEAKNKGAQQFTFDIATKQACASICSQGLPSSSTPQSTAKLEIKTTTPTTIPSLKTTATTNTKSAKTTKTKVEVVKSAPATSKNKAATRKAAPKTSNKTTLSLLLIIIILIVFFLAYQKYKGPPKTKTTKANKRPKRSVFFIRKDPVKHRQRIREAQERDLKRKRKERETLFSPFGIGKLRHKQPTYIDLLGKVAQSHELRKRILSRDKKEQRDIFKIIKKTTKRLNKNKMKEHQAKNTFEKLRKIIMKG